MIVRKISGSKKSSISTIIAMILFALMIAGCASVQTSTVASKQDSKKVWRASLNSLNAVGFSAIKTDAKKSIITAGPIVAAGGKDDGSRMTITVEKKSPKTVVVVKYEPAKGSMGGQDIAGKYVDALKKKIPDLETVVAK